MSKKGRHGGKKGRHGGKKGRHGGKKGRHGGLPLPGYGVGATHRGCPAHVLLRCFVADLI